MHQSARGIAVAIRTGSNAQLADRPTNDNRHTTATKHLNLFSVSVVIEILTAIVGHSQNKYFRLTIMVTCLEHMRHRSSWCWSLAD
jgi:hypothetical protein